MKKFAFLAGLLVFTFSFAACSPDDAVQRAFGNPEVKVEVVDIDGNVLPRSGADFGPDGEFYENTLYYLKGTIYVKGYPVTEGDSLSKEIEWSDETPVYTIINFLDLSVTNDETLSGQVMQIKTKTLQGTDTQKDAVIKVRAFFAHAPEKKYRFKVIKRAT